MKERRKSGWMEEESNVDRVEREEARGSKGNGKGGRE